MRGPKSRRFFFVTVPLFALIALAALPACDVRYRREVEEPGTPAKYTISAGGYMRYDGYDDVAGDLEIASTDYAKPGSAVRIRLVGVVHFADADYYRELQRQCLDTADLVLFEGVKFEGAEPPVISAIYSTLGTLLGVSFQKDGIDYTRANFEHCDVTVKPGDPLFQQIDGEQLAQASVFLRPLAGAKALFAAGGDVKRTEDALKHAMVTMMSMQLGGASDEEIAKRAREFGGGRGGAPEGREKPAEKALEALKKAGPLLPEFGMSEEMKREILDKRNTYVVDRLKEKLASLDGDVQRPYTIAVFYGAAHMEGIGRDLAALGYGPCETVWLKAWRMNGVSAPIVAERIGGEGARPATPPAAATAEPKRAPKPGALPRKKGEAVLF